MPLVLEPAARREDSPAPPMNRLRPALADCLTAAVLLIVALGYIMGLPPAPMSPDTKREARAREPHSLPGPFAG